jgi:hypothetical protein
MNSTQTQICSHVADYLACSKGKVGGPNSKGLVVFTPYSQKMVPELHPRVKALVGEGLEPLGIHILSIRDVDDEGNLVNLHCETFKHTKRDDNSAWYSVALMSYDTEAHAQQAVQNMVDENEQSPLVLLSDINEVAEEQGNEDATNAINSLLELNVPNAQGALSFLQNNLPKRFALESTVVVFQGSASKGNAKCIWSHPRKTQPAEKQSQGVVVEGL